MKKAIPILIALFVSMYFIPQVWYLFIAVLLGVMLITFCLAILAFLAKGLGIAGLEAFAVRKYLKYKRAKRRAP